jgi:hypothetical protein
MNKIILLLIIAFSTGCIGDHKFVRKEVGDRDITVKWFFYSYITDDSPDFITVELKGKGIIKEICKAKFVITDVFLEDSSIVVKLFQPSKGLVLTKSLPQNVFGYPIVFDSTATQKDLWKMSEGTKEVRW